MKFTLWELRDIFRSKNWFNLFTCVSSRKHWFPDDNNYINHNGDNNDGIVIIMAMAIVIIIIIIIIILRIMVIMITMIDKAMIMKK